MEKATHPPPRKPMQKHGEIGFCCCKSCKTRPDSVHVCTCSHTRVRTRAYGEIGHDRRRTRVACPACNYRPWLNNPVILLTAPIRAPKFLHIRYERWTPRAEYVSWILTGLNYGRLITRAVIEAFATKRVAGRRFGKMQSFSDGIERARASMLFTCADVFKWNLIS